MGTSDTQNESREDAEDDATLVRSGSTTRLKASTELPAVPKTVPGPPPRKPPQASMAAQKAAANLLASLPQLPFALAPSAVLKAAPNLLLPDPGTAAAGMPEIIAAAAPSPTPPVPEKPASNPTQSAPQKAASNKDPISGDYAKASMVSAAAVPIASSGMAGPYHLALEIASGGMATVYLAVHGLEGFQNTVAVKRIHPHLAKDKQFVDMFVDEAHIAARINHPYVCRVFDFGKSGDSYYIAMEFLRGEPLSRVFKVLTPSRLSSPRHPAVIARIIANLAEGLHAAHTLKDTSGESLDVVHRDVTPQNLFVLCDGTVRVTDFGIARARVRSHHTEGGKIKGKLSYMSPEQLNQQPVDCRTDIWSLGVVAWELLTGRRLFRAGSEGETVLSVLSRAIPAPSQFESGVPRQLDAIVLKALARDPAQRYLSARELVRALEGFLASSGDTVPSMDIAEWLEDLFPGASARSDGLVQLAHAVIPPERRASFRPNGSASKPAAGVEVTPISRRLVAPEPAPSRPFVEAEPLPVPASRWGRSLLVAGLVLAGLGGGVVGFVNRAQRSLANSAPQTQASESKVAPPVQSAAPSAAAIASAPAPPAVSAVAAATPAASKNATVAPSRESSDNGARRSATSAADTSAAKTSGERTGSLMLMTKNGRAEVFLGARSLGTTPITLELPVGTSILLLKPIGGGESQSVTVAIQPGTGSLITVPLTGAAHAVNP